MVVSVFGEQGFAHAAFEVCQTMALAGPVTVNPAEMMKFPPVAPWETSTKLLPAPGTAIVTPPGIAPAPEEVNVVPVPLGQADPEDWKQKA